MTRYEVDRIRTFVISRIERDGLTTVSRLWDVPISTLRSVKDGRDFQVSTAVKLSEAIARERGQKAAITSGFEETAPSPGSTTRPLGQFLGLPWHHIHGWKTVPPFHFDRAILEKNNISPETLAFVQVNLSAFSWAPRPGDVILIDTASQRGGTSVPWVFIDTGAITSARLTWIARDKAIASGDHPDFTPKLLDLGHTSLVRMIGRILWSAPVDFIPLDAGPADA